MKHRRQKSSRIVTHLVKQGLDFLATFAMLPTHWLGCARIPWFAWVRQIARRIGASLHTRGGRRVSDWALLSLHGWPGRLRLWYL